MKTVLLISLLCSGISSASFEKWTNKDGKSIDLELLKVEEKDGEKIGVFKMRNLNTARIAASALSEADAKRLDDWKPEVSAPRSGAKASVFDEVLAGNLLKLEGGALKPFEMTAFPAKYYVFYYTASWCPPCRKFTPELVGFYEKHKNANFELVLITSDRDEAAMEAYAVDKKMPWPMLKLQSAQTFKQNFQHGIRGIPSLIVCDLKGKNLGDFRGRLDALEELIK